MIGYKTVTSIFLCIFLSTLLLACADDLESGNADHKAGVTLNKSDTDVVSIGVEASNAIVQTYPLLIGDYLSVEYIDILRETRSPLAATERSDGRQYIFEEMLNNEPSFTIMGGFHQGLGGLGINAKGELSPGIHGIKFVGSKILNDKEFMLMFADKNLLYRYVGNLDKFIASQTVVGKYKSDTGTLYTFTEDGAAIFPGKTFKYEVFSDYVSRP